MIMKKEALAALIFLKFMLLGTVQAQELPRMVSAALGPVYSADKKAMGYHLGFDYFFSPAAKPSGWAVGIQHLFTQRRGRLPEDISSYLLRDHTNPRPFISFSGWSEKAFPSLRLSSTPDKYFDFGLSVRYLSRLKWNNNHNFLIGGGAIIAYHEEMEIAEFIRGDIQALGIGLTFEDLFIPIFRYDAFWDLGMTGQLMYQYHTTGRLSLSGILAGRYFPKSKRFQLPLSFSLGIRI